MSSPTKSSHAPLAPPTQPLGSPRTAGRLRKLQSAHQLSSNYAASNNPSLISQQRQQQQQQQQRQSSGSNHPPVPAIPPQHSPQKHHRSRSNSDAVVPSLLRHSASPKRLIPVKNIIPPKNPKQELEFLVKQGPKDNVPLALQDLRHWILCDGMDADTDGMVDSSSQET